MVPGPREAEPAFVLRLERQTGETSRAVGRRIVHHLLSPNLAHVRRIYDPTKGVPLFVCDRLIDVIYWQLADELTTRNLRQCLCGQVFFAQDKRQQVCPPLPGRRESRCGIRFRTRKWRAQPD